MIKVIPKVGQVFVGPSDNSYSIIRVDSDKAYTSCGIFCHIQSDGKMWLSDGWTLAFNNKLKPKKVIPDIPLDPSLHILEAGYIQDRARKRFK